MSMVLFGLAALMIGFVGGVILAAVLGLWLSGVLDRDEADEMTPAWTPAPAAPAPTAAPPMTRDAPSAWSDWGQTPPEKRRDWRGDASGVPRPAGYDTLRRHGCREDSAREDFL